MIAVILNGLLLLGLAAAARPAEVMVLGAEPRATLLADRNSITSTKRCRYNRPRSFLQAACSDLGLEEIPRNLQSDIQILDFSVNRLRELKAEPLSTYTSLAYVYLQDNFIETIDDDAFTRLRSLEVLDLTKNGVVEFPRSLLPLPRLRKLYFSRNKFKDEVFETIPRSEELSLQFLELSQNKLTRIPAIGTLPSLAYLNVSKNAITSVSTADLAPFCSLEVLDLSANDIKFNASSCDCFLFNAWIQARRIKMKPAKFDCGPDKICPQRYMNISSDNSLFPNETISAFENCLGVIQNRAATAKARSTWILVGSCLAASLLVLFLSLYCIHKRNNRKKKRQRLKQQQLAANNANTELLNGNMPPEQT